jgi:hypothetical protein
MFDDVARQMRRQRCARRFVGNRGCYPCARFRFIVIGTFGRDLEQETQLLTIMLLGTLAKLDTSQPRNLVFELLDPEALRLYSPGAVRQIVARKINRIDCVTQHLLEENGVAWQVIKVEPHSHSDTRKACK